MVRLQSVEAKRQREKRMVQEMVALYCRKKHGGQKRLCPECAALAEYAGQRSDRCPFMETKTFCSNCSVHCYRPDMREKIRAVMRWEMCIRDSHQVHGLDDGGRAGAAHHIRRIIGDGAHDEYVVYAIADDVQHIEHPRVAAEQHFGRAAGAYVVLVVRDLYDALLCGEIVCEAADDADSAHDHGGEQEPAGAAAVDEVAAVVQRAEQLEPVSYTHLDVYKTQTLLRWPS